MQKQKSRQDKETRSLTTICDVIDLDLCAFLRLQKSLMFSLIIPHNLSKRENIYDDDEEGKKCFNAKPKHR